MNHYTKENTQENYSSSEKEVKPSGNKIIVTGASGGLGKEILKI